MGHVHVSVLEEGDGCQPGVDEQVGANVKGQDLRETGRLSPPVEEVHHEEETHVGERDLEEHLGGEQLVWNDEVARESSGWSSSHSDEKVERPPKHGDVEELDTREALDSQNVLHLLVEPPHLGVHDDWIVGLSLGEVVGFGVMHKMRVLPGEVRDEEGLVEHIPQDVIQYRTIGKGTVTALMSQDP